MEPIKPYNNSASKKVQVRTMFNRVAPSYDRLNHLLTLGIDRRWRRRVVREAAAESPREIVDIATGTGDLALLLARGIPTAHITGADLSEGMLAVARAKIEQAQLDKRIALSCQDAEHLTLDTESADCVTVAFGVRNFEHLDQGLAELRRILRNGGKLIVLEFSMPKNKIFGAAYRFYFNRVLPWIGGIISGDRAAYEYLPRSVAGSVYGEAFVQRLKQTGFSECRRRQLLCGIATLYVGIK